MAKVIAVCGKICSGKSYYAKVLKEKYNAVILSIDEATYDLIRNEQGEFYNAFVERTKKYLMKKAVQIVNAGCNVIFDWGFWTKEDRKATTKYFRRFGIDVEWHYIDTAPLRWKQLIADRNAKVQNGNGGYDFYVDEGLLYKFLSEFEEPEKNEIDVWIENK